MADTPDKTPAKGVLPKNLQTWILAGIALLVTAVIFLSGGSGKAPTVAATPTIPPPPPGRPADLTSQVKEALAQQEADQARAQQEALTAESAALAAQLSEAESRMRGGYGAGGDPNYSPHGAYPLDGGPMSADEEVKKQRVIRRYNSLWATQLAHSYRTSADGKAQAPTASPSEAVGENEGERSYQDERIAALDRQMAAVAAQSQQALGAMNPAAMASMLAGAAGGAPPSASTSRSPSRVRASTTARNQVDPSAQHYMVLEGTVLEAILVTRLAGDFSGPVLAQLSAPVYSRNMQHVLLPAGTRVIGQADRVEHMGQTRLAVAFHRVVAPDGYSVDLDLFSGLSSRGETALKDQVNNHYRRIFGTSIALGLLGGLSSIGTSTQNPTTMDSFRQGSSASLAQSASEILNKFLNILPTVTIREGHRMRIWIAQDLALPAYDSHRMPGDL